MGERRDVPEQPSETVSDVRRWNDARCVAGMASPTEASSLSDTGSPLSPGDIVKLTVAGNDPPSGTYRIDTDGELRLNGVGAVRVAGRSVEESQRAITRDLVSRHYFRPGFGQAALTVLDRGAVRVNVSGAVFEPGRTIINGRSPQETDPLRGQVMGDHFTGRTLSVALSNAAGVRPDADVGNIAVERDGRRRVVDFTGFFTGEPVDDIMLVDGDRVIVPSRRCFQSTLARPSPITPPGVRVFFSNLVVPATNNAGAALSQEATRFPYGTRLLQALASGNCIGGAKITNADRWAVLVTSNPLTGSSEAIERRIEALVRRSDRDAYNPVLLPNDTIACYDSTVTNIREILRSVGDAALSASIGTLWAH